MIEEYTIQYVEEMIPLMRMLVVGIYLLVLCASLGIVAFFVWLLSPKEKEVTENVCECGHGLSYHHKATSRLNNYTGCGHGSIFWPCDCKRYVPKNNEKKVVRNG